MSIIKPDEKNGGYKVDWVRILLWFLPIVFAAGFTLAYSKIEINQLKNDKLDRIAFEQRVPVLERDIVELRSDLVDLKKEIVEMNKKIEVVDKKLDKLVAHFIEKSK